MEPSLVQGLEALSVPTARLRFPPPRWKKTWIGCVRAARRRNPLRTVLQFWRNSIWSFRTPRRKEKQIIQSATKG